MDSELHTTPHDSEQTSPDVMLVVLAVLCWFIAAAPALYLLKRYALDGDASIAVVGGLWLLVGGGVTLCGELCAAAYAANARRSRYLPPHTRWLTKLAVILPWTNVPLAAICIVIAIFVRVRTPTDYGF